MDENNQSLMSKNVNDLTVGDALKINLVVLAVTVGGAAVVGGAFVVAEKFSYWNTKRKAKNQTDVIDV